MPLRVFWPIELASSQFQLFVQVTQVHGAFNKVGTIRLTMICLLRLSGNRSGKVADDLFEQVPLV